MENPRVLTGARVLGLGILGVVVAAIMAGSSQFDTGSQLVSALCVAIGGAAAIVAGGIMLAAERSEP